MYAFDFDKAFKEQKMRFKDHFVKFVHNGDDLKYYIFQNENGSGHYRMDIVCHSFVNGMGNIIVTGDLGCWVFECTWEPALGNLPIRNDGYFLGKISRTCQYAYRDDDEFNKDLDEYCKQLVRDCDTATEKRKLREKLKEIRDDIFHWRDTRRETQIDNFIEELEKLRYDCLWKTGVYDLGMRISPQLRTVLVGLKVAQEAFWAEYDEYNDFVCGKVSILCEKVRAKIEEVK
jgi:hypothetical protein